MKEIEIINKLSKWLESHFKTSDLLIESEVKLKLDDDMPNYRTDLVVIQSKSNVIHAFEIKKYVNESSFNSAIWQADSLYGNYKWLVLSNENFEKIPKKILKEKGIGLIVYSSSKDTFKIELQPNYIDGNILKYYPLLEKKWYKIIRHGSNSRTKKKN